MVDNFTMYWFMSWTRKYVTFCGWTNRLTRFSTCNLPIDHLHARTKEFISTLIMVTSWLDAVVASMNVLNPMKYWWCITFKCMLWFKYTVHVNFANSNGSIIHFHTLSHLLESESHLLTQSYSAKNLGLWWIQLKTKVIRLIAFALYAICV